MERVSVKHAHNGELEAIGRAIRSQRSELKLSQEALADKAGLDRSHMGRIERGQRNLSLLNLLRICSALQIRLSQLLESAGL
jgi:transcriptional regulator with XRE-family HTH domain